ncbi:type II secretion system protein GspL [Pseudomonas sp.]|uniref:type II secretion system protein GspL n=1 Tax=Pseudomonas sp. TaxID=306 RepID=UPI0019E6F927|nr:type II secretion system protein GspL [Pseudomonas sp.]MBF0673685.1 type II secretion system protein GspL [Pseudomonas sp.]
MTETWVFLPPAAVWGVDPQLDVHWVRDGVCRSEPFEDVCAVLHGPWRLILPVEAVTSCSVQLPTQKKRWLRKALPFAVEEWLAEDIEQMHLALGAPLADGRHRVFAVRRDWLSDWLALCAEPPGQIRVDADLLPEDATWLCWLDGRWLLGGLPPTRLALSKEDGPELAKQCPEPLRACVPQGISLPAGWESLYEQDPHVWLSRQAGGCNLAQGEFAVQEHAHAGRRWLPVFGALGVCLLLQWGFNLAQGWQLQRAGEDIARASTQLYQELFPDDRKLINLRQQFDQHLAGSANTTGEGLLGLLGQASGALLDESVQLRVQQLDFSAARGDLALQVQAPSFEALERVRERLIDAGLAVQLGSASREAEGVSARLVIGG